MKLKAVIDRFEEDQGVLLIFQGEQKLVVPRKALPEGAREGDWLELNFEGDPSEKSLKHITVDEAETRAARQRIEEKLSKLRRGDHRDS